jgi:uncharacterized protein YcaQ
MRDPLEVSLRSARRLNVIRQRLAGHRPKPDRAGIEEVVRDIGCLQLDPISVVAPSQQTVLFSRLGKYDVDDLNGLVYQEKRLFEYWAHGASIVSTLDYPIHSARMRAYQKGERGPNARRLHDWVIQNRKLLLYVRREVRKRGPVPSSALEDRSETRWTSSGWTNWRNVDRILFYMWIWGELMVADRRGGNRYWDLAGRCLPAWTPRDRLSPRQLTRAAAQRSLRSLGTATAREIELNFIRYDYPGLKQSLEQLERDGLIVRLRIRELPERTARYVHSEDLAQLQELEKDSAWQGRVTVLSPFDNLFADRARAKRIFDLDYRIEIYVPPAKRQFGYYSLPILDGDRFIGLTDCALDRKQSCVVVRSLHALPGSRPSDGATAGQAIRELAAWLGARKLEYPKTVPASWKKKLE